MDWVLSIHTRFAESILRGEKTHELRRRLPTVSPGDRVFLYATKPTGAIVGGFVVKQALRGSARQLWRRFGHGFALRKSEFDEYTEGADVCVALEVDTTFRLRRTSSVAEMKAVAPAFSAPQSVCSLRDDRLRGHLDALRNGRLVGC